ncbi:MAG: hypothetical protein HYS78_00595 [Parcubacteria group bacterium]|nr:hypothetical protein [Parcubacteria group bacterium]
MLSKELERLVSSLGGLVIIENSQPKFVVLSYDKFMSVIHKSIDNSGNFSQDGSEEITDRLNKEILALKEQVAEKERELSGSNL